jgi:hypothetical protein
MPCNCFTRTNKANLRSNKINNRTASKINLHYSASKYTKKIVFCILIIEETINCNLSPKFSEGSKWAILKTIIGLRITLYC